MLILSLLFALLAELGEPSEAFRCGKVSHGALWLGTEACQSSVVHPTRRVFVPQIVVIKHSDCEVDGPLRVRVPGRTDCGFLHHIPNRPVHFSSFSWENYDRELGFVLSNYVINSFLMGERTPIECRYSNVSVQRWSVAKVCNLKDWRENHHFTPICNPKTELPEISDLEVDPWPLAGNAVFLGNSICFDGSGRGRGIFLGGLPGFDEVPYQKASAEDTESARKEAYDDYRIGRPRYALLGAKILLVVVVGIAFSIFWFNAGTRIGSKGKWDVVFILGWIGVWAACVIAGLAWAVV